MDSEIVIGSLKRKSEPAIEPSPCTKRQQIAHILELSHDSLIDKIMNSNSPAGSPLSVFWTPLAISSLPLHDAPLSLYVAPNDNAKPRVRRSSYRGVIWDRGSKCWRAKLSVNGKLQHVGLFDDEWEAAVAWDQAALLIRGTRTRLNFPEFAPIIHLTQLKTKRTKN